MLACSQYVFISACLRHSFVILSLLLFSGIVLADTSVDSFDTQFIEVKELSKANTKAANNLVQYSNESAGISLLEFSGNYNLYDNDQFNVVARSDVATELYANIPDNHDFVVVFTTFPVESDGLSAFATVIKNDAQGIGKDLFDNSNQFGSEKLQLMVDMKNINNWSFDPNNPEFEETLNSLMHEIMHRWGISVKFMDANSQISDQLLGNEGGHWNYFLNSNASIMYQGVYLSMDNLLQKT